MQRYMSNPKHGRMPVYSDSQIASLKTHGWIEETLSTKTNVPEEVQEVVEKPRRGRKPGVKHAS